MLGLLFGQPGRSIFTKELIGVAGGGSGAVQRELARLQASGLITQTLVGHQKHDQANARAPIFNEFCAIAQTVEAPVVLALGPAPARVALRNT